MPVYYSASGSLAEDLFIDLFSETFGAEKAGQIAEEARQMIAAGQTVCPCPGCQAGHAVLEVKEGLFE